MDSMPTTKISRRSIWLTSYSLVMTS